MVSLSGLPSAAGKEAIGDRRIALQDGQIREYGQTAGMSDPTSRSPVLREGCLAADIQLDVYYPDPSSVSDDRVPVLFFVYGGGFTSGSRRIPSPFDLAYSNLGTFFAKRG